jgi:hypothetical protein
MPGSKASPCACDAQKKSKATTAVEDAVEGLKNAGKAIYEQGKEFVTTDASLSRVVAGTAVTGLAAIMAPGVLAFVGGLTVLHATCKSDKKEAEVPTGTPRKPRARKPAAKKKSAKAKA